MAMKKKESGGEEGGDERWLITYADLITLLLVLFLILYSIANLDNEKFKRLKGSLASAFDGIGIFAGQSSVTGGTGGEGILARFSSVVENVVSKGGGPGDAGGATLSETSVEQDFEYISNQIDELVTAFGLQDMVSVERTSEGIVLNLAGDLLFLNARAELRSESFFVLDRIAEILRPLPNQIRIEGHTDSIIPFDQTFPTNWHLSGARALAVLQFLEEFGKIPTTRMHFTGWADLHPVADNDTLEGRLQNRRASIVVLYPQRDQAAGADALNEEILKPQPEPATGTAISDE
jgi:chemotaxis protein MotB